MPGPNFRDLHINRALSNISVAYRQDASSNFVFDKVFPTVPVQKQQDIFWVYEKEYWFKTEAEKRAPGSQSKGTQYGMTTDTYRTEKWALHYDLDEETEVNADDGIDPERDATELLVDKMLLRAEKEWIDAYFQTGVWGTEYTGANAATHDEAVGAIDNENEFLFFDDDASDPIRVFDQIQFRMKRTTGLKPNVVVMGEEVFLALKNHPDIIDRIKYTTGNPTTPSMVTQQTLAALFGFDRLLVPGGIEDTRNVGSADSESDGFQFLHNTKSILLANTAPRPSLRRPSAGYTFQWNGLIGSSDGMRTMRWWMQEILSTRIEVEWAAQFKVVAPDLGAFVSQAVA